MSRKAKQPVIAETVELDAARLLQRVRRLENFRNDAEKVICTLYDRLRAVEDANTLDARPGSLRLRS